MQKSYSNSYALIQSCRAVLVVLTAALGPFAIVGPANAVEPQPNVVQEAALKPPAAPQPAPAIVFRSAGEAFEQGVASSRVTAIVFSATWCGWCRKMETTTFTDEGVRELAQSFSWAKVDIDDQPQIAAAFGVRGVPAIALVNVRGELLASRSGYLSPDAMHTLISPWADKADAPGAQQGQWLARKVLAEKLKALPATEDAGPVVAEAIALLADGSRAGRTILQEALADMGPRAWLATAGMLHDDRLAVRAAGAQLLTQMLEQEIAFDPFAARAMRSKQADACRQWVKTQLQERAADLDSNA